MIKYSARKNSTLKKLNKRKTLHLLIGIPSVIIVIISIITIFIVFSTNDKSTMDYDGKVETAYIYIKNPCTNGLDADVNVASVETAISGHTDTYNNYTTTDKLTDKTMDNVTNKTLINYIDNDTTTNTYIDMYNDVYTNPPYADTEETADGAKITVKYIDLNTDKVTNKHILNRNNDKEIYDADKDNIKDKSTNIDNIDKDVNTNPDKYIDRYTNAYTIDKSTEAVTDTDTSIYIDNDRTTIDKYIDAVTQKYIQTHTYSNKITYSATNELINTAYIEIEYGTEAITTTTTTTDRNLYTIDKNRELATDTNWSQPDKYSVILNIFEKEHLEAHNFYRKLHGCPPLKISREISEFSQHWAEKIAADGEMSHSIGSGYGENIYWSIGMEINGSIPVDRWYGEYRFYNFGIDEFSFKTGHLTQLLWKSTELIGIGVVFKNSNEIYVVTNYYPKGNIPGQFYKMVPKILYRF